LPYREAKFIIMIGKRAGRIDRVPLLRTKYLPVSGALTLFLFGLPGERGLESSLRMHFLLYAIIVIHVVVCFFLIGVVLLQQGKSADLAGTFGGQGSQTAFGPRAAANLLTKMTAWAAGIFMVTSLGLTILYLRSSGTSSSVFSGMKSTAPVSAPAKPGK
jgi:preprotein translocase subunit SecG